MEGIGKGIMYIKIKIKCLIRTQCLEFCFTGLTLSVIYSANLLKLLILIKILKYFYEYSRHNRPVSVNLD